MAKLGLFGGTFDPPHLGHLLAATTVTEKLGLFKTFLITANNPTYYKDTTTPALLRDEMVRAAVKPFSRLESWALELDYDVTYTIDMLRALEEEVIGKHEWYFIIGFDQALDFHNWKDHEQILSLVEKMVVCITEPSQRSIFIKDMGYTFDKWSLVWVPPVPVRSTMIRQQVANGFNPPWITPGVLDIIHRENLYVRT